MPGEHELVITIMSGPDDGRQLRLRHADGDGDIDQRGDWVLTMGRRDDCDVCLPFDTQVSRLHARLFRRSEGWVLEDCGSRNGTFVGKKRIEGVLALETGTLFRIGRTWLRIEGTGW